MTLEVALKFAQFGVASVTFGGMLFAGVMWIHRKTKKALADEIRTVFAELKPQLDELKANGGGSMLDMVRRIDTELVRVGAMQRLLIGVTNGAVWECDTEGRCIYGSPALAEMLGLDRDAVTGSGWTSAIVTQSQRITAWAEWKTAIREGVPYSADYVVRNQRTGERFVARASGHPVTNSRNQVIGFIGTVDKIANVSESEVDVMISGLNREAK